MNDDAKFTDLAEESATGKEPGKGPMSDRIDKANEKIDEVGSGVERVNEGMEQVKNDVGDIKKGMSEISEKISANSAADAANEKQQSRVAFESNANVAGNQHITQNIYYGGYHSGLKEVTDKNITPDPERRVYDLTKADDFAAFGEEFNASEQFAFAIMLSVFEYVELDDVQNLKSKLLDELPRVIGEKGKEIVVRQNPFFPINSILKTIQGKMYETKAGEKCIGLGDSRSEALKNLWEQFPSIRSCISRWLFNVSETFEYRTNFDTYQITTAFVNILKLDFSAGIRHIFQRLYSSSRNAWLLGAIALMLYDCDNYRKKILPIMNEWASSKSQWLWKPAFYAFSYIEQDAKNDEFDTKLHKTLEYKLSQLLVYKTDIFDLDDVLHVSRFLIYSERARTLVANIFRKLAEKRMGYDNKKILIMVYLLCLRTGYFAVTEEYTAFPLVACDTKEQLLDVLPLAGISLQKYETRRTLFSFIEAYLKELAGYSVEDKVINHIKAFFVLLAERNERHVADILMMLNNCKCQLADDIVSVMRIKLQRL